MTNWQLSRKYKIQDNQPIPVHYNPCISITKDKRLDNCKHFIILISVIKVYFNDYEERKLTIYFDSTINLVHVNLKSNASTFSSIIVTYEETQVPQMESWEKNNQPNYVNSVYQRHLFILDWKKYMELPIYPYFLESQNMVHLFQNYTNVNMICYYFNSF